MLKLLPALQSSSSKFFEFLFNLFSDILSKPNKFVVHGMLRFPILSCKLDMDLIWRGTLSLIILFIIFLLRVCVMAINGEFLDSFLFST